jgi:hypothetical protein
MAGETEGRVEKKSKMKKFQATIVHQRRIMPRIVFGRIKRQGRASVFF